jgi:hypothetical protein
MMNGDKYPSVGRTKYRQLGRLLPVLVVMSLTMMFSVRPSGATVGTITKADLSGPWQAALVGSSGCGTGTLLIDFTLNTSGTGSATLVGHSSGCGDTTVTGQTFNISSVNANGSGVAGVSCGVGCGFNFKIQVSPDRGTFNIVDTTDPIPNFWAGTAVHQ